MTRAHARCGVLFRHRHAPVFVDEVLPCFRRPIAGAKERVRAAVFDGLEKVFERDEARLLALAGASRCGSGGFRGALPYPEEERELRPVEGVLVHLAVIEFRRGDRSMR